MIKQIAENFKKLVAPKQKAISQKPIAIERSTINDSFSSLSIKEIKRILYEEDFSELNALYFLMMQRDLHLASEINKRKMQLLTTEYMISGSDKAKKFLDSFLEDFKFYGFLHELTAAIPYGFSFIDLIWDVKSIDKKSAFVPVKYKQLSQRFIYADNEEQKYLKDTIEHLYIKNGAQKQFISQIDNRKLISHIHKTDTGFITDFVLLNKVAWFVALKHSVIAANMQWYDSLGTPPLIINYDSDDKDDLNFLLSQALSLRSNGVGIFPSEATSKLLEGKGNKSDFLSFIQYIDGSISQYILGNTLAGGDANKGNYGTAKIHAEIKKEYLVFDAKAIGETINEFLNIVLEQNFANEKVKFSFVIEDNEGQKELSDIYKNIEEMGWIIPTEHIEKKFGITGLKRRESLGVKSSEPNRIEANKKALKKPIDHIDAQTLKLNTKAIENELVSKLHTLLEDASSYEEAYELLEEENPDIKTDLLEDVLFKVLANSALQGDIDVSED